VGFLKACGQRLYEIVVIIATASLQLGHLPRAFKIAKVAILATPGKPPETRRTGAAWRPIPLLSTTGKIIEAVVGQRLTRAVEEAGTLPKKTDGQQERAVNRDSYPNSHRGSSYSVVPPRCSFSSAARYQRGI